MYGGPAPEWVIHGCIVRRPLAHTMEKGCNRGAAQMKNFWQCMFIVFVFMLTAIAILEVDRQCKAVTGYGGEITASVMALAGRSSSPDYDPNR